MMMPRKKRRAILISVILVVIIIILTILIVLYNTTDMFKSNDVLFSKYASQIFNNIDEIFNEEYMSEMEDILNNNKLSSNLMAKAEYTENGNMDNPVNTLKMNVLGQTEKATGYNYKDITLVQNEQTLAGVEYIEEDNISGIRLNGIRQYLSTNIDSQNDNGIYTIYDLMNTDMKELITFSADESANLKDKYIRIVMDNLVNANYSKQANVVIEINGVQYSTNVYTVTITKEQFNNIYIKILEEIQKDDIILSKIEKIDNKLNAYYSLIQNGKTSNLKQDFIDKISNKIEEIQNSNIGNNERTISVFETDGIAISISIDTEEYFIGLDVVNTNESNFINFLGNEKIEEDEKENSFDFKIQKKPATNNEEITIDYNVVEEGKQTTNECIISRKMENAQVNYNIGFTRSVDQNNLKISIDKVIDIVNDFDEKEELVENENNIILENLNDDQKANVRNNLERNATNQLNNVLQIVSLYNLDDLLVNIGLKTKEAEDISNGGEMTETEKNRFNSEFELFEGENISKERIKELMNFVKGNLEDIRITQYEEQDEFSESKIPLAYRLVIKKDTDNSALAEEFVNYIEESDKQEYSIELEYDETTGLVSNVYITAVTYQ